LEEPGVDGRIIFEPTFKKLDPEEVSKADLLPSSGKEAST